MPAPDQPFVDGLGDLLGRGEIGRILDLAADRDDVVVTVATRDLDLVWISRRGAEAIFGSDPIAFEGRNALDFVHADDVARAAAQWGRAAAGDTVRFRLRARHPGGAWVTVDNVAWAVGHGDRLRLVGVSVPAGEPS